MWSLKLLLLRIRVKKYLFFQYNNIFIIILMWPSKKISKSHRVHLTCVYNYNCDYEYNARATVTIIITFWFSGGNDPFTRRLSIVSTTHELDILAEVMVRGPGTVSHEIRMERNRNGGRIVADNNELESRR